mgnify:CR=1 FL=1
MYVEYLVKGLERDSLDERIWMVGSEDLYEARGPKENLIRKSEE